MPRGPVDPCVEAQFGRAEFLTSAAVGGSVSSLSHVCGLCSQARFRVKGLRDLEDSFGCSHGLLKGWMCQPWHRSTFHISMRAFVCMCMYNGVYIHTYIHTHTHIQVMHRHMHLSYPQVVDQPRYRARRSTTAQRSCCRWRRCKGGPCS